VPSARTQTSKSYETLGTFAQLDPYWQAKEIHRVIQTNNLPEHIDLNLLSHISPVSWENIILYGDYLLNRNKVAL